MIIWTPVIKKEEEIYLGVFQMTCGAGFPVCQNRQTKSRLYVLKLTGTHSIYLLLCY